jgi:hypothetical protein
MKKDDHLNLDNQQPGLPEDRELERLLASWRPPESSGELDQRTLASYRRHFNRGRLLRRWLAGSIRIPVPIAAAAVLLLCATSFLAARKTTSFSIESPPTAAATTIVEVPFPVIQEKIVTRVIRLKAEQGNPKPDSGDPAHGAIKAAQSNSAGLASFRPVEEIKILVSTEENKDEK